MNAHSFIFNWINYYLNKLNIMTFRPNIASFSIQIGSECHTKLTCTKIMQKNKIFQLQDVKYCNCLRLIAKIFQAFCYWSKTHRKQILKIYRVQERRYYSTSIVRVKSLINIPREVIVRSSSIRKTLIVK